MTTEREEELVLLARRVLPSVSKGMLPDLPAQIELGSLTAADEAFLTGYVAGMKDAEARLRMRRPLSSHTASPPANPQPITHPMFSEQARARRLGLLRVVGLALVGAAVPFLIGWWIYFAGGGR